MTLATVNHAIRTAQRDGVITGDELRAIIREAEADGIVSKEEKRALRAFIEKHAESTFTDDAKSEAAAFLKKHGIGAGAAKAQPAPMTETDALRTVLESFDLVDTAAGIGDRDGLIARSDLQAIIDSPGASERLKTAARFLLANFSRIDDAAGNLGRQDGLIARCDLETAIAAKTMDASRAIEIARANHDYLDTAARIGRKDGIVGTADLETAIADPKASAEVKAAARFLLDHPGLVPALYTKADLDVAREGQRLDARGAVQVLIDGFDELDTAAGIGPKDGIISPADLEAVASNDKARADLRAAAKYLLAHPELYGQLDDAAKILKRNDGLIGKVDLARWLDQHPKTDAKGEASAAIANDGDAEVISFAEARAARDASRTSDAFEAEIDDILTDPTMTIEDQVAMVLMLIMKQMDKDIQAQTKNIQQLQKGAGTKAGDTSIDVETMKLKRLIDKRGQMFDMLRQIIDKYNQTAKGIIDTIGR